MKVFQKLIVVSSKVIMIANAVCVDNNGSRSGITQDRTPPQRRSGASKLAPEQRPSVTSDVAFQPELKSDIWSYSGLAASVLAIARAELPARIKESKRGAEAAIRIQAIARGRADRLFAQVHHVAKLTQSLAKDWWSSMAAGIAPGDAPAWKKAVRSLYDDNSVDIASVQTYCAQYIADNASTWKSHFLVFKKPREGRKLAKSGLQLRILASRLRSRAKEFREEVSSLYSDMEYFKLAPFLDGVVTILEKIADDAESSQPTPANKPTATKQA